MNDVERKIEDAKLQLGSLKDELKLTSQQVKAGYDERDGLRKASTTLKSELADLDRNKLDQIKEVEYWQGEVKEAHQQLEQLAERLISAKGRERVIRQQIKLLLTEKQSLLPWKEKIKRAKAEVNGLESKCRTLRQTEKRL